MVPRLWPVGRGALVLLYVAHLPRWAATSPLPIAVTRMPPDAWSLMLKAWVAGLLRSRRNCQTRTPFRMAVQQAVETFSSLHTAVYAAGPYLPLNVMARIKPTQFQDIISNDLFGAFNFLHYASTPLLDSTGVMVAIVTPAMKRWAATDGLSAIPKAAIQQIIRGFASEHGAQGLRANCVGVGLIEGGMVVQMLDQNIIDKKMADKFISGLPLRRMGTLEEVASAVAFLSSDLSQYTTGQTLMVDGGYSV